MKNSWLIISALVLWVSCNSSASKEEADVVPLADASENLSYSKFGLTKLSEYGFFTGEMKELQPAKNVLPYELNAPLFTDYAEKKRFIYLPEGTSISYHSEEVLDFPEGTILIKNFYYSDEQNITQENRIIETRLLVLKDGSWNALPYIWNNDQTEAYLDIMGGDRQVEIKGHGAFRYSIPNMKQCKTCHDYNGKLTPIGPSARQLSKVINGQNQLNHWVETGKLDQNPERHATLVDYSAQQNKIDDRARAYLDGNCSYCHRPEGSAKNSGLDLTIYSPSEHALGIYKGPVAAGKGSGGLRYDIVPGKPKESILIYRMNSNVPEVMMPELGRSLIHQEGVELLSEWIENMKKEPTKP